MKEKLVFVMGMVLTFSLVAGGIPYKSTKVRKNETKGDENIYTVEDTVSKEKTVTTTNCKDGYRTIQKFKDGKPLGNKEEIVIETLKDIVAYGCKGEEVEKKIYYCEDNATFVYEYHAYSSGVENIRFVDLVSGDTIRNYYLEDEILPVSRMNVKSFFMKYKKNSKNYKSVIKSQTKRLKALRNRCNFK